MSLYIKDPGVSVNPTPLTLDGSVNVSCNVHSDKAQTIAVTASVEDTVTSGQNTTHVKIKDGDTLVDSIKVDKEVVSGTNAISISLMLIDDGVQNTGLIAIRMEVKAGNDSDSRATNMTVKPKPDTNED